MDLINEIANMSTALSMAQVRNEVGVKVLKIAQSQGQVAADLVSAAAETVSECIKQFADNAGANLDVSA
jgi:SH3-like domain-containing protein